MKNYIVSFIRDWFKRNGNDETKALIGISGGKDSAVVAAACVEALGKDRVIGVMMPNGTQSDIADSQAVIQHLGIKSYEVNIGDIYNALKIEMGVNDFEPDKCAQFRTNAPSRLRMVTLYSLAALIGNCRVTCNGNKSEGAVGYFTLWGDGAGDIAPLANLYVDEVIELGRELGLPEWIINKAPADGMCGKTDEENLGCTYNDIKNCMVTKNLNIPLGNRIRGMQWKRDLISGIPAPARPAKALVIVDAQNDFIDGPLGVGKDRWYAAQAKILEMIDTGEYEQIVFTADWHPTDHCSFKENGGQWPAHCVQHTEGAWIDKHLWNEASYIQDENHPDDVDSLICVRKGQDANLEEYAATRISFKDNIAYADVVGLCREYCVEATADWLNKNSHVTANIVEEGCVSYQK